jgi:hypothetical protein
MTRYIGCETARDLLDSFVDGELPVTDQVMVEAHLRWCKACSARVEDMSMIGAAVRMGSPATRSTPVDDRMLAALQDEVLSRVSVERGQSFTVRVREMFEDMHLLWPALGACCAVLICLAGASTVLYATSDEHPKSLAALITSISNSSGQNPLLLDNTVAIPRGLDDGPMLDVSDEEALVTLATVVSSEGRIADFALLQSEREVVAARHDRGRHQRELDDLLLQIKQSRFEPAQALSGRKVAVNMVWMIARTTVRGSIREADVVNAAPVPARKREVEKPAVVADPADPNGVVSATASRLPTA